MPCKAPEYSVVQGQGGLEAVLGAGSVEGGTLMQHMGSCAMISMVPLPKESCSSSKVGSHES